MANIVEFARARLASFQDKRARRLEVQRGVISSANFFWLMDQVRTGKIMGESVDSQGNTVNAQKTNESLCPVASRLEITERIPGNETLGLHTILEMRGGDKRNISTSIRIIQVATKEPVSSASVFFIKKTSNNSSDFRYDRGYYEPLHGNFTGLGYGTVLQPKLFQETVGRAYAIVFNLLIRKKETGSFSSLDLNKIFPPSTNS